MKTLFLEYLLKKVLQVCLLCVTGLATYLAKLGGFRHLKALSEYEQAKILKVLWATQPFGIMGLIPAKISVAFTILRITGSTTANWIKWTLYSVMVSTFIINVKTVALQFAQCNPPKALWTPGLQSQCWDPLIQADFAIFTGGK